MITFLKATKIYPGQSTASLSNVDLKVENKDIFGIIGFSGAGKSTLMRCLIGLERLTSGAININGLNLDLLKGTKLSQARKTFGMVFQNFNLLDCRTAGQNIAYPLEINHEKKDYIDKRVDELLSMVGLLNKKHVYPANLSGGEKQRIGIARALANNPSILLCDEATSALDPKSTQQILELLKHLNKTLGLTILLITHEMDVVKTICNKVAVLEKGIIVEQGRVQDVFSKPCHPTTKNFLASSTHVLPSAIKDPSKTFLRLCFYGKNANEPIISNLIKTHPVSINILLGGLDCIEDTIIGNLVVEVIGSDQAIKEALKFLDNHFVTYEKIED
jgi:D-methionine transport system ATP-binding protein